MTFTEDLDQFFGASRAFGNDVATYGGSTWYGVYDNGYAEAGDMAGTSPAFTCATADIPGAVVADVQIAVNGVNHKVKVAQPEEDGAVTVLLLRDTSV